MRTRPILLVRLLPTLLAALLNLGIQSVYAVNHSLPAERTVATPRLYGAVIQIERPGERVRQRLQTKTERQAAAEPEQKDGFWLGILLGWLLGPIGLALSYFIWRKKYRRIMKGTWIGLGIFFALIIVPRILLKVLYD